MNYQEHIALLIDAENTPLAMKLREAGVRVMGVGRHNASEAYRNACTDFLSLYDHEPLVTAADFGLFREGGDHFWEDGDDHSLTGETDSIFEEEFEFGEGNVIWDTLEDGYPILREPAGMGSVHKLLRVAYDHCKDENGLALLSATGNFIKDIRPELNYRSYGFRQLHRLLLAYPDRYELIKSPGRGMVFRCCT